MLGSVFQITAYCILLALPFFTTVAAQESNPRKHRIVFGGDRDYPPYEYLDEAGVPKGFHIDLMRAIGEVMGFEVEFRLSSKKEVRQAFKMELYPFIPGAVVKITIVTALLLQVGNS